MATTNCYGQHVTVDSALQHWSNITDKGSELKSTPLMDSLSSLKCAFCRRYLLKEPRQLECGDRACGDCYDSFLKSKKTTQTCPVCGLDVPVDKSFRDKAVEVELANTTVKCTNPGCTWLGEAKYIEEHFKTCRFAVVSCPNVGCRESIYRSAMEDHLATCQYTPVLCEWCGKKITEQRKQEHLESDCEEVSVQCTNGCKKQLPRKQLPYHLQNGCPLNVTDCEYKHLGCDFRGNSEQLAKHEAHYTTHHLKLMYHDLHQPNVSFRGHASKDKSQVPHAMVAGAEALDQEMSSLKKEIQQLKAEISKMQPVVDAVVKVESTVQQLQEGFGEMALMVQTLQATSYSGTFIWKIPEVKRRRNEAMAGKTISLYSAPFYTSRHGYKLCLRVYMDGDGTGKGTHLSFFLTIMRGEYDALLPWPFRQTVTLMLLDQDKQQDVIQSFRPEPTSSSFQRPRSEMNIASGCPTFAPLSVLKNSSYVKDDTMFFKCKIDLSGLEAV